MNPLTPGRNQRDYKDKMDEIMLCGKNMGSHDYIPVKWISIENIKRVSILMCRVCFKRISMETLERMFKEIKIE